jgi:hypothetical protein
MNKLYRQITLSDDQEDEFVFPHKMAMTGEKLHSKSEIAYELGIKDMKIAELKEKLAKTKKDQKDDNAAKERFEYGLKNGE